MQVAYGRQNKKMSWNFPLCDAFWHDGMRERRTTRTVCALGGTDGRRYGAHSL